MARFERMTPAVFLDRDGVVCENRPDYVKSWSEVAFIPGSVEAIASLSNAGVRIFIVTNQAAVGKGLISRRQLDVLHERMLDVIRGAGGRVESVFVCPHHPDDRCACRKPEPGMLTEAAERFGVDLARSFMVGDAATDIAAGKAAGCRTVLVKTGRGADAARALARGAARPDFVADDLVDAAIWILAQLTMQLGARTEVRS